MDAETFREIICKLLTSKEELYLQFSYNPPQSGKGNADYYRGAANVCGELADFLKNL